MVHFTKGRALPRDPSIYVKAAKLVPCRPRTIAAIVEAEAAGSGYWKSGYLKNLPEKHYMYRRTPKSLRSSWLRKDWIRRRWSRKNYANLKGPRSRYIMNENWANGVSPEASAQSTSWGAGQVMGANYRKVGHSSAMGMYKAFADSENEQILAIVRFCLRSGLKQAMQIEDTKSIARVYNGTGQVAKYSRIIDRCIRKWAKFDFGEDVEIIKDVPIKKRKRSWIGMGDGPENGRKEEVITIQKKLRTLGYMIAVDGDFGPNTRDAVIAFQIKNGLKPDGLVGVVTLEELENAQPEHNSVKRDPINEVAEVVVGRETETADDLVEKSTTVKRARQTKLAQKIQGGAAAVAVGSTQTGVVDVNATIKTLKEASDKAEETKTLLQTLIPDTPADVIMYVGILVAAFALYNWWKANQIENNRVEEHNSGKNIAVGDIEYV